MDYIVEVRDIMEHLTEDRQRIVFDVARNFLEDDDFDFLSPQDLEDIRIARKEFKDGQTIPHSEVFKDLA
jgi:hypothetical protein